MKLMPKIEDKSNAKHIIRITLHIFALLLSPMNPNWITASLKMAPLKLVIAIGLFFFSSFLNIAKAYPQFKGNDDLMLWLRSDTIAGHHYTQEERQAYVDSIKQDYRSTEVYKMMWEMMDTIPGKVYTGDEKDSIMMAHQQARNGKALESVSPKEAESTFNPFFVVFILILISLGVYYIKTKQLERKAKTKSKEEAEYEKARIEVIDHKIYINNNPELRGRSLEHFTVFELHGNTYPIEIYEDNKLIRTYKIEPYTGYESFKGLYLHASIRIQNHSGVQIDGLVIHSREEPNQETYLFGYRFEGFFLSDQLEENDKLIGKNSFHKGLNYAGLITPKNVIVVGICHHCKESINLLSWHTGFSDVDYFYSDHSKEILGVSKAEMTKLINKQGYVDLNTDLDLIEAKLPQPANDGSFKYFNPLCCPHCLTPYFDFANNHEQRRLEYYAHYYVGQEVKHLS